MGVDYLIHIADSLEIFIPRILDSVGLASPDNSSRVVQGIENGGVTRIESPSALKSRSRRSWADDSIHWSVRLGMQRTRVPVVQILDLEFRFAPLGRPEVVH